jgi:hypothetical protein
MLKSSLIALALIVGVAAPSYAATMVGGAKMFPSKTIVQNASKASNLPKQPGLSKHYRAPVPSQSSPPPMQLLQSCQQAQLKPC